MSLKIFKQKTKKKASLRAQLFSNFFHAKKKKKKKNDVAQKKYITFIVEKALSNLIQPASFVIVFQKPVILRSGQREFRNRQMVNSKKGKNKISSYFSL